MAPWKRDIAEQRCAHTEEIVMHRTVTSLAVVFLILSGARAFASPQAIDPPALSAPEVVSPTANTPDPSSNNVPTGRFKWSPAPTKDVEIGVNFGLLQLALGGFNVAGEVRYRRLWLEYSHGMDLTLNNMGGYGLSPTERAQSLHIVVPYTTGFGVGATLSNELWLGVEVKAHRYDVNAPGGPVSSYDTYSIGPVVGYKLFLLKGLYVNAYGRYWPTVATSMADNRIALQGTNGTVTHTAHDWGLFANVALGYEFHHRQASER
jgi:hypothetical protein